MEIGDRVRQIRMNQGLSTYDLSQKTGISQSTISKLENKKRKADSIILEKIAEALSVSVDRLTGESVSCIIENRLEDLGVSLESVAEKSQVSLHWLQNIDTFIPGQLGDEIGYDWITRVAEVIDLPGSKLRAALARQEAPLYDSPMSTAEEAFKQAQEDFKEPYVELNGDNNTKMPENIRVAARNMMDLSPEDQKTAFDMIKFLSQKGKEAKKD